MRQGEEKKKRHGGEGQESDRNAGQTAQPARALGCGGCLVTAGDWIDLSIGVDLMNAVQAPPKGQDKGDISLVGGSSTTVDITEDTAIAVEDTSARVAQVGEQGVTLAIQDNSDFERAIGTAEPGARHTTVHDDKQSGHALDVEAVGILLVVSTVLEVGSHKHEKKISVKGYQRWW
ncbi:hypothetical protein EI94DRAFT_1698523 [Lactarius quietus]|nr:hypothetical protein EI94DRAFT_1698523 [Lactarius quietus]